MPKQNKPMLKIPKKMDFMDDDQRAEELARQYFEGDLDELKSLEEKD